MTSGPGTSSAPWSCGLGAGPCVAPHNGFPNGPPRNLRRRPFPSGGPIRGERATNPISGIHRTPRLDLAGTLRLRPPDVRARRVVDDRLSARELARRVLDVRAALQRLRAGAERHHSTGGFGKPSVTPATDPSRTVRALAGGLQVPPDSSRMTVSVATPARGDGLQGGPLAGVAALSPLASGTLSIHGVVLPLDPPTGTLREVLDRIDTVRAGMARWFEFTGHRSPRVASRDRTGGPVSGAPVADLAQATRRTPRHALEAAAREHTGAALAEVLRGGIGPEPGQDDRGGGVPQTDRTRAASAGDGHHGLLGALDRALDEVMELLARRLPPEERTGLVLDLTS